MIVDVPQHDSDDLAVLYVVWKAKGRRRWLVSHRVRVPDLLRHPLHNSLDEGYAHHAMLIIFVCSVLLVRVDS